MKKVYLTWDDIDSLVNELAREIESSPVPPDYITGLQRGGLIPAVMLSHKLNIPFVRESIIKTLPAVDVLVVDDIADTGETLNSYKKYATAVLHYKFQSEHIPTYFAAEVADDIWLSYPWEKDDAETIQDYKIQ